MLTAMRDGAQSKIIKFFLFGFLLLAVGGMALMDVGGFFRGGVGMNHVVKAGDETIGGQQFDSTVRRILTQQGLAAPEAYKFGLIDQILRSEVSQRLLTQAGFDMGIYAGDDVVSKQIQMLVDPVSKSQPGVSKRDVLRRLLQNQGMSEQDFITTIRRSMMNSVVQTTVQSAALPLPRAEAVNLYLSQNESRNIDAMILTNDSVKDVESAQEEVLTAFYEAAKAGRFAIPETRSFSMAILTEDNIKDAIKISDDDLRKEYDKSAANFTSAERRVVQQAVLEDEAAAKAVIAKLAEKSPLKDAVKAVTGKQTAYLGEETFEQKGLLPAVAADTFKAAIGDTVGPVKTPLGYHVLVVGKIIAPEKKSFDSVKDDLRRELTSARMSDGLMNAANAIDDRLAGGESLDIVAKENGMKIEKFGPLRQDGSTADKRDPLKDLARDRDYILQTVFDLNQGETAPVMELSDGRYAVIHIDTVTERSFKPYEAVKGELAKTWITDQKAAANASRARALQQEIESGTKTLAAAASDLGLRVETITLKRTGDAPKNIGPGARDALFAAIDGETAIAEVPDGYVLATVKSVTLPDPAKISDTDLKPIIDAATKAQRDEMMLTYMQYLEKELGVKINRALLDTMYGPESTGGSL